LYRKTGKDYLFSYGPVASLNKIGDLLVNRKRRVVLNSQLVVSGAFSQD
jgi:hypothetical protein